MPLAHKWDPKEYNCYSSHQKQWGMELIAKLGLNGTERLLDLGCGDGKVTSEIARRLPKGSVVGLDISQEMVEYAIENYPPELYSNLRFQIGDAANLQFNEEFDIVFSSAALHWVKEHRPVLEGIKNALKPGGLAFLQMGGSGNASDLVGAFGSVMSMPHFQMHFQNFEFPYATHQPSEYTDLLEDAGLEAERVEFRPKVMSYDDVADFVGWLRTTWMPFVEQVPESMRDELLDQVVEVYLQRNPADYRGRVKVMMLRLEVEAIKPAG
jgi:trans-aconitate 2-methyltransferase